MLRVPSVVYRSNVSGHLLLPILGSWRSIPLSLALILRCAPQQPQYLSELLLILRSLGLFLLAACSILRLIGLAIKLPANSPATPMRSLNGTCRMPCKSLSRSCQRMIWDRRSDHFNARLGFFLNQLFPTSPQAHQFSANWSDRHSDITEKTRQQWAAPTRHFETDLCFSYTSSR